MRARLKYRLSALERIPFCDIEVFEDSSEDGIIPKPRLMDFASGETFAEAREKAIAMVRGALLRRRDQSLEIPPSEEIELEV